MVAERSGSAQELNTELMQQFFNSVINNLRTQTEQNWEMTQQLADQQERQRETTQALLQESVDSHMDFMNSMFSFYQEGIRTAEEGGRRSR